MLGEDCEILFLASVKRASRQPEAGTQCCTSRWRRERMTWGACASHRISRSTSFGSSPRKQCQSRIKFAICTGCATSIWSSFSAAAGTAAGASTHRRTRASASALRPVTSAAPARTYLRVAVVVFRERADDLGGLQLLGAQAHPQVLQHGRLHYSVLCRQQQRPPAGQSRTPPLLLGVDTHAAHARRQGRARDRTTACALPPRLATGPPPPRRARPASRRQ